MDIYAVRKDEVGELLYMVECKRYSPTHPVGIELVRALYGVKVEKHASAAVLVTSSYFTAPARAMERELRYEMTLRDYDNIQRWFARYVEGASHTEAFGSAVPVEHAYGNSEIRLPNTRLRPTALRATVKRRG